MPSQEVWMPWLTNLPRQKKNSLQTIYYMGVSENSGTPKSSTLIEFSIINHPFWGTPIFRNIHIYHEHPKPLKKNMNTYIPWATKTMKNKDFGRLKTRLFTKTSQNVGLGGPMVGKQKPTKKGKTTVQHVCFHLFRNFNPTKLVGKLDGKLHIKFSTNKSRFMKKTSWPLIVTPTTMCTIWLISLC